MGWDGMGWHGMGKTHSSQGEAGRGKFVSTYSSSINLFFHAFWDRFEG